VENQSCAVPGLTIFLPPGHDRQGRMGRCDIRVTLPGTNGSFRLNSDYCQTGTESGCADLSNFRAYYCLPPPSASPRTESLSSREVAARALRPRRSSLDRAFPHEAYLSVCRSIAH
jgi:hypothetical protein